MINLLHEQYKVQTLSMFIEVIEICVDEEFTCNFSTSEMYDLITEVLNVEVDYNHLGTLVGMGWLLDQLEDNGDVTIEVLRMQSLPPHVWQQAICKLREVWQMTPDPDAWVVLVSD